MAPGGCHAVDDPPPRSTWPEGHEEPVADLADTLSRRPGRVLLPPDRACGVPVAVRR